MDGENPFMVMYIAPSLQPNFNNPSVRFYHYDDSSLEIVDHETWTFNLGKAVTEDLPGDSIPQFQLEYTAKEKWGLKDLSPLSWQNLYDDMIKDTSLFSQYLSSYDAQYTSPNATATDTKTVEDFVCGGYYLTKEGQDLCRTYGGPAGLRKGVWIGTSPACDGEEKDCFNAGLRTVKYDKSGIAFSHHTI